MFQLQFGVTHAFILGMNGHTVEIDFKFHFISLQTDVNNSFYSKMKITRR